MRLPTNGALEAAGPGRQVTVNQLATGLDIGIAALPIMTIFLLCVLPPCISFARKAGQVKAAVKAGASIDLLACGPEPPKKSPSSERLIRRQWQHGAAETRV